MSRRTSRPVPRRRLRRVRGRTSRQASAAVIVSAAILAAVLAALGLTVWNELQANRRVAAAWRRVGHCAPVGTTNEVTCTGVHLVVVTLPPSIGACADGGVCRVKVNREAAPAFQGALAEVADAELGPAVTQFQTVNRRRCRDAVTGAWIPGCVSKHSYGIAVDFRPADDNVRWESVTDRDPRIMEVVAIFQRYGFRWGGTFQSNVDPQHLEWQPGSRLPDGST